MWTHRIRVERRKRTHGGAPDVLHVDRRRHERPARNRAAVDGVGQQACQRDRRPLAEADERDLEEGPGGMVWGVDIRQDWTQCADSTRC